MLPNGACMFANCCDAPAQRSVGKLTDGETGTSQLQVIVNGIASRP